ncbi:hypothetical protein [Tardiphaga sp.]|uniref:hypothetical protein n=1 Tax=Tardiphaga sp. TaxID=1926292 RepID=UPI0026216E96|nr:hypothetical protein [Tardiphaga sp.]MDB5618798.1 hypothetical protein [Tardiphaga sp.]
MQPQILPTTAIKLNRLLILALGLQIYWVFDAWSFYLQNGYLPAPFIYNKFDVFMDVYNPLWWSSTSKYTDWGSVYPPINFPLLDLIGLATYGNTTFAEASEMRDASLAPAFVVMITAGAATILTVCHRQWSILPWRTRGLIAAVAVLSPPILFSIERANLIVLGLLCVPFFFGKRPASRALALALAINLKPYFALLLLEYLLTSNQRGFLLATALAGSIFIFTGLACDADFLLFLENLTSFSQSVETTFSGRELVAFPSSISAFAAVIEVALQSPNFSILPADLMLLAARGIELTKFIAIAAFLATIVVARRSLTSDQVNAALIALIINLGVWVGGYSQIFYLACIPALMSMRLRWFYLAIVLLIFLPLDLVILNATPIGYMISFLSRDVHPVVWQMGLGSFARPVLNLFFVMGLTTEFAAIVWPESFFLKRKFFSNAATAIQPSSLVFPPSPGLLAQPHSTFLC